MKLLDFLETFTNRRMVGYALEHRDGNTVLTVRFLGGHSEQFETSGEWKDTELVMRLDLHEEEFFK